MIYVLHKLRQVIPTEVGQNPSSTIPGQGTPGFPGPMVPVTGYLGRGELGDRMGRTSFEPFLAPSEPQSASDRDVDRLSSDSDEVVQRNL